MLDKSGLFVVILNVFGIGNVHVQIFVDVYLHAGVEFFKQFFNHAVPVSFFVLDAGVDRDGQFAPGFKRSFRAGEIIGVVDF